MFAHLFGSVDSDVMAHRCSNRRGEEKREEEKREEAQVLVLQLRSDQIRRYEAAR